MGEGFTPLHDIDDVRRFAPELIDLAARLMGLIGGGVYSFTRAVVLAGLIYAAEARGYRLGESALRQLLYIVYGRRFHGDRSGIRSYVSNLLRQFRDKIYTVRDGALGLVELTPTARSTVKMLQLLVCTGDKG